ncbi:MAG: transcription elongation factor GreA [Alphaproteobacteria bacterium]
MDKIPMTKTGFEELQEELKRFKTVERPEVIKAIAEARQHGDLSENAEYHAAREKQSFIEGRISELENKINKAEIINVNASNDGRIKFGATVAIYDENIQKKVVYQIVGSDQSDIKKGLLSITSPLAKALIGKKVDDTIEVITPNGNKEYTICKIQYL